MNVISLVGRLTDKPELAGEDKKQYCRFTLAVQRDKDTADFIDAVAFGQYANVITKNADKGEMLGITGRLETGIYTDKDDIRRKSASVIVGGITLIGKKESKEKAE